MYTEEVRVSETVSTREKTPGDEHQKMSHTKARRCQAPSETRIRAVALCGRQGKQTVLHHASPRRLKMDRGSVFFL